MRDLRAKARECLEEAAETQTEEIRQVMERLALVFQELAEQAEQHEAETRGVAWLTPFWASDNTISEPMLEQVRHT